MRTKLLRKLRKQAFHDIKIVRIDRYYYIQNQRYGTYYERCKQYFNDVFSFAEWNKNVLFGRYVDDVLPHLYNARRSYICQILRTERDKNMTRAKDAQIEKENIKLRKL